MTHIYKPKRFKKLRKTLAIAAACATALCALPPSASAWGEDVKVVVNNNPRPLTKLKSAVKFFVKNLFKLREIWYNVGIENSVIMGCRNAFGRNKPTNKNGVCMYRGFGTERPYFKKDR